MKVAGSEKYKIWMLSVCLSFSISFVQASEIDTSRVSTVESFKVIDRNINVINIVRTDTVGRIVLPHRIQPVLANRETAPLDSAGRCQKAVLKAIDYIGEANYAMALVAIYDAKNYVPYGDTRSEAIAEAYYGIINIEIGNYTKAVSALNCCDSLFRKLGDLRLFAFHYNNLGLFYQKFRSEKMADTFFDRALSISRTLHDEESIAISLNNLAKGDSVLPEKIKYLEEAVAINKKLGRTHYLADNYNNLAKQYGGLKQYSEAEKYVKMARDIALKYNLKPALHDNYEISARLYAAMGKYKEAYVSLVTARESLRKIAEKQYVGDVEQMIQNKILSQKNYELKLRKKELDINQLTTYLVVVMALLFILALALLYINSRRKMRVYKMKQAMAEKEIEHANSEMVNIATFLGSRNELLNHLQITLSKTSKLPEEEMQQELKKMNLYIKNLQTGNEEAAQLLQKIAKINEGFIVRLSEKHPELTKNDKNIALLLRANLTTKQIAILMECDPKSVNMARYRMRQHLNISNDINLNLYLKSL